MAARFARQFDGYRGNGIFAKQEGSSGRPVPQKHRKTTGRGLGKKQQAAGLERKNRELTAQLESVMASPRRWKKTP